MRGWIGSREGVFRRMKKHLPQAGVIGYVFNGDWYRLETCQYSLAPLLLETRRRLHAFVIVDKSDPEKNFEDFYLFYDLIFIEPDLDIALYRRTVY